MAAQNWMIGDWYQWYAECRYYPYKVKPEDFTKDYIANFEPIPLTPEILRANGFSYVDNERAYFYEHYILRDAEMSWNIAIRDNKAFEQIWFAEIDGRVGKVHMSIKYVHQLQHALRLCGLTDLANNFKID